jgi:hypothetical protein
MNIRKLITILLILCTLGVASAQVDPMTQLQVKANIVRSKMQTTQSKAQIAQMAGNSQMYRICEVEANCHQYTFNYLQSLAQNPQQLNNPSVQQQLTDNWNEYIYRTSFSDYRPAEQALPSFQQWLAQRQWEVSTPQGQQAYAQRQQNNAAAFQASQNQHRANVAQFDNYFNSVRNDSNQRDKYAEQYVNTIHDRYEYVNPYDGQRYMAPNTYSTPPVMENPDGSYTELVPYQNY